MPQASSEVQVYDFSHPGLWIPAYLQLNWKRARYKLLYGSRGRGATTNVVQVIAAKMLAGHLKGMMVRKVFEDIKGSQWDSFKQWAEEHKQDHNFVFQKAPLEIICKPTESRLVARGMNNPGRAKSVPGLSLAWYEEADELSAEDFRQTSLSIREDNIEEWLTFNSPMVDHWLLERFFPGSRNDKQEFTPDLSFEREDGMFTWVPSTDPEAAIMHACYKHNPFNRGPFITQQERDRDLDPDSYRTSGLGLVGKQRTGNEFFDKFKESIHVKKFDYDPDLALHISFDFNTAPYMTLLVAQIRRLPMQRWHVHFLQEICLEPPISRTKDTCERFKMELRTGVYKGHKAGLFFYGDASGRNKTSMATEEVANNYEWVDVILGPWIKENSDRALRHNPLHVQARDWSNDIFCGKLPIEVTFDQGMTNTIRDMNTLKQAADGGILKEMVTVNGVRFEKGGHCGQAMYYLTIGAFPAIFEDHQKIAV